jgi:tetratricopeptide (TPR) repeat protein
MENIDLEAIFIRRKDQLHIMNEAAVLWQRQMTAFARQPHAIDDRYRCIIWLSGGGGLGKSTLLKHYREELSTLNHSFYIGKIIDWSFLLDNRNILQYYMKNDYVDEMMYTDMLYRKLSEHIDRRLHDFKEYKRKIQMLQDIEKKVDGAWQSVQRIAECGALWKVPKSKRLKLLQWFVTAGFYEQDGEETIRQLRKYIGGGVAIEIACINCLKEEIERRLGEKFNDYLQAGSLLSMALGYDLRHFASERPLLIFFDTYECIEKGGYLLKNTIEAAGINVGWCIAGRSPAWTDIDMPGFSSWQRYKLNGASSYPVVSVPLQVEGPGSFSFNEISYYFAQLCERQPSLPAIGKEDVERIRLITRGIPLAVSIVAQFYKRTGRLDVLFEREDGTREVIEGMVERYLLYVPYDKKERIVLYGMAMLRSINDQEIISQLAGANIDRGKPLEAQLYELLNTAHAIFIGRDQIFLHQEIRHFLRLWLLKQRVDLARQETAQLLQALLQARIDAMEKYNPYQGLGQRFEDDAWVNEYLDLVEAQFWQGINHGFFYCLPFMLASVIYQRDLLNDAVAVGNFFRTSMTPLQSKQWGWMVRVLQGAGSFSVVDIESQLEKLQQFWRAMAQHIPSPFAQWQKELEGAFHWKRAEFYQKDDRYNAVYWYEEAIKCISQKNDTLQEDAAYVCWLIALDLYEDEKYEESLEQLQKALKIKHDFADANYLRGNIYYKIHIYNKAIIEYQYAIALDDHHIAASINLGNTYLTLERYQEAVDLYSEALALEPRSASLYSNRALAYTSLGAYENALADYHQTIALQPDFAEAYTSRGTVYAYLHRYKEALVDYERAYKLFPHNIYIAWMRMWANLGEQRTLERETVDALILLDPEHYLAHVCRGISLALQRSRLATILVEIEHAILMAPDQWDHYFWKGMICCYYKNTIMAQEAFEKARVANIPSLFLKPLYWLKTVTPQFFETYIAPLLASSNPNSL